MAKKKTTDRRQGNELNPKVKVDGDLVTVTIKFKNDKNGGHPHVQVDELGENLVSVGLSTHAKKGKNSPNYKLTVNPLGGKDQSYMRRQGTVAPKKDYKSLKKGVMAPKDFEKAKTYGEKAKQKHLEKQRKKK